MKVTIGNMIDQLRPYRLNEHYFVSDDGRVYSKRAQRWLTPVDRGNSYLCVSVPVKGKIKQISIHRMVAEMFLDNPNNKPCVNHKDGDKINNNVSNLEWASYPENSNHAWENGLYESNRLAVSKSNKKRWQDGRNEKLRSINKNRTKERWLAGEMGKAAEAVSKKVIDTKTGIIYKSCVEAAKSNNINKNTLRGKLSGRRKNNTNLKFYCE